MRATAKRRLAYVEVGYAKVHESDVMVMTGLHKQRVHPLREIGDQSPVGLLQDSILRRDDLACLGERNWHHDQGSIEGSSNIVGIKCMDWIWLVQC
jgi:hypothetical protein